MYIKVMNISECIHLPPKLCVQLIILRVHAKITIAIWLGKINIPLIDSSSLPDSNNNSKTDLNVKK